MDDLKTLLDGFEEAVIDLAIARIRDGSTQWEERIHDSARTAIIECVEKMIDEAKEEAAEEAREEALRG